jgi:hypothetical protein
MTRVVNTYLESSSLFAKIKESKENSFKGVPHTKMVLQNEKIGYCSRRQDPWCLKQKPHNICGQKLLTCPTSLKINHPFEQTLE